MFLLEPFILDCTATYKKNKRNFSIANNDWTLLQRKIRTEFLDLLEDVDESEITIKPSANNVIKDKETFYSFLETVPKLNGLKSIKFTVETRKYAIDIILFYISYWCEINIACFHILAQINFSKYKRITDLVNIFGANIKDLTTIDDLPQMEFCKYYLRDVIHKRIRY